MIFLNEYYSAEVSYMNYEEIDYELGAMAVERLSQLMKTHRAIKGRSVRTLARKLKVKRRSIKSWESGKRCPPGPIMLAIFQHYGSEAYRQLHQLHFNLQIEKYNRTLRKVTSQNFNELPAVIWDERQSQRRSD